jgi:hypothetical protein
MMLSPVVRHEKDRSVVSRLQEEHLWMTDAEQRQAFSDENFDFAEAIVRVIIYELQAGYQVEVWMGSKQGV